MNRTSPVVESLLVHEFPLEAGLIYLNHAAVSPWPRRTADAVTRFAQENLTHGAANYENWLTLERNTRAQCATLIGATSPDDIAFLKNTSEALSVVAHGFPWVAGDNVVISDEEFPSNRIVWESLASKSVAVRLVSLPGADPEQALLDGADARTRLISVSSVQYASGRRMDLARLGELCRRRGIALCVDAIQGLGAVPHDVNAMHIDFLMADAHKWLLGPAGIGIFYCRPEWRERLTLYQYGWHMVDPLGDYDRSDWRVTASARRFECGSQNMLGLHALAASVALLLELGAPAIEQRVLERAERIFEAVARYPELALVTSATRGRYAGIVTFSHQRRSPAELYTQLRQKNVVCAARGGGVRFSPHCYTPLEQIDTAVALAAGA